MTENTYTYTKTYRKKDGTLSIYTYTRKYGKKGRPEKVIPEEIKKEIIRKWELGVSKKKIERDYNLSWRQVYKILPVARSNRNSKLAKDEATCPVVKVEETTCPVVKDEETEETTCPIPKAGSEPDEIDEIDEISEDSIPPTPKLSILVETVIEYVTGKKYSELKADYEKRGENALQLDWNKFPELKIQYERRKNGKVH